MIRILLLGCPRLVVYLAGMALLGGAVIVAWLLVHRETLVPVSGGVTVNGTRLQSGIVTFYSDHSRGNTYLRSTSGKIKDGRYELWTYDKKGLARKGVPPGWYRVVVEGYVGSGRGTEMKIPANVKIVEQESADDKKEIWIPGPPGGGNPKDFFSNYNKPQVIEVTKAGAEDAYDLALTRSAPERQRGLSR
jgi:hypothetical protein